jgi:hypothetical protein
MLNRDTIATGAEIIGALTVGVGIWLFSPAISLIWFGAIIMIVAWSMTNESRVTNGNSDTEGD